MTQQKSHFLFFFIFFQALFSSASHAISPEHAACSPLPYACGNTTFNISYPFQLAGRPDYCGFPGYYVKCTNRNSTLTITISNKPYQITSMDHVNRLLNLVDPDFVRQSCPQPYVNTTIDSTLFEYSDRNRNLTLFINCTASTSPTPTIVDIGCFAGLTGQHSYYRLTNGSMDDVLGGCASTVVVPLEAEAAENLSNGSLGFSNALQMGFYVNWLAGKDWCGDCESSGGYCGNSNSSSSMDDRTCFCVDRTSTTGSCTNQGSDHSAKKLVIGICVGTVGLASFLIGSFVFIRWFRLLFLKKMKAKHTRTVEAFLEKHCSLATKRYTYSQVKKMTKSFREKLGQGGYGSVYKGKLFDGRPVAVKVLSETKSNGEDFINEVAAIGNTSHVNVVSLRGFCVEGPKRALIYDFMPNGSLEKYINSEKLEAKASLGCLLKKTSLGWEKLYEIAVGIARGLEYLHRGCNTRIVHFDIKPHNILLDQDFCPKISDFGMAKLCRPKQSIISMCGARGTIGYIAPEVFSRTFGVVSSKSDVYSYGMMVLEMFGGKSRMNTGLESTSEAYFPQSIYQHLNNKDGLVEYEVTCETEEIARKMMIVGFWCIQTMPENRPSMSRVVEMLEGSINDLPIPPKPILSSPLDLIACSCTMSSST